MEKSYKKLHQSSSLSKKDAMHRYSWKAAKMKFLFRFFAMLDVLFAPKFELQTYRKDGSEKTRTRFDKAEIDNAGCHGLL